MPSIAYMSDRVKMEAIECSSKILALAGMWVSKKCNCVTTIADKMLFSAPHIHNMNKYTKLIFVTFLSAPLFAIAQTTIFKHNFDGVSNVQLGGQTTDTGDGLWQNSTAGNISSFRADGSVVNDPADTHSGIWLPVTIEQGKIYTLSADVDLTSTSDWISLGYAEHRFDNAFYGSGGYGTAAVKANWVDPFTGVTTDGKQTAFTGAGDGVHELKIVLDATAADTSLWTMEFFSYDVSVVSPVYADSGDYANIKYIGFTKQSNATGTIDNFKFSVESTVPETSQYGLIAAVIAALVVCSRRRYRETS